MIHNILLQDACILVATSFDEQAPRLVKAAGQLAVMSNLKVKIVNVVDFTPMQLVAFGNEFGIPPFNPELLIEEEDKALSKSTGELQKLAQLLPLGVRSEIKAIPSSSVAEAVAQEAAASRAALILCGAGDRNYMFVPKGFSVPLSLMANASVPVITMRRDVPLEVGSNPLRLLVADDLRQGGQAAIEFSLNLAQRFKGAVIEHIFVNQLNIEAFSAALRIMSEPARPATSESEIAALYEATRARLREKLEKRAGKIPGNSKIEYKARLCTGEVAEEIANVAEMFNPDLIIFGRHITLHRQPFVIGAVPFKIMLKQNFPVVIAPS